MRTRARICASKRRYATYAEALAAALEADIILRPYGCERCRAYHLTSRTKGKRIPRAHHGA
ncbi:hypothetical protein GTZ99_09145 [Novosphingobium sp. FSY-8]|uniref:Uncharacterized protein n=1 Tax=Novosphingobium ovatum TaxID=1908523 RepID=A0ABW9XE49_9SPHN|nr:hypothetical protein [Novosphingobium ovatum]NBC36722.1 hypothetical protein [Novosphingobium ovatum]